MMEKQKIAAKNPNVEPATAEEIEAALDEIVPDLLQYLGERTAIRGWRILFKVGFGFTRVGQTEVPYVPHEGAEALVKMAETNPHAFDAAGYIAGMQVATEHISGGKNFPLPLRVFAARVLTGEISRPTQKGRPLAEDVPIRLIQYACCRLISEAAGLHLGRNREPSRKPKMNACQAVADAFTRAGHNVTDQQLQSLCFDDAYEDLREVAACLGLLNFDSLNFSEGTTSTVN